MTDSTTARDDVTARARILLSRIQAAGQGVIERVDDDGTGEFDRQYEDTLIRVIESALREEEACAKPRCDNDTARAAAELLENLDQLQHPKYRHTHDRRLTLVEHALQQARQEERERCAQVALDYNLGDDYEQYRNLDDASERIARAIRDREKVPS
jgi:hypothetical protein